MGQYIIDTNVVSDYLTASIPDTGLQFMDTVFDAVPNISVISQIELLCWKTKPLIEKKVQEFISDCKILIISPEVIEACVIIRRNKKIKIPDALIAATAIVNKCTLISRNTKDFKSIKGLNYIDPYKI